MQGTPQKGIREKETHAVFYSTLYCETCTICGVHGCLTWTTVQGRKLVWSHQRPCSLSFRLLLQLLSNGLCLPTKHFWLFLCLHPKTESLVWLNILMLSSRLRSSRPKAKAGLPTRPLPLCSILSRRVIVSLRMNKLYTGLFFVSLSAGSASKCGKIFW